MQNHPLKVINPYSHVKCEKSDVDKILGLGLGADDYVTKPSAQKFWLPGSWPIYGATGRFLTLQKGDRLSFSNLVIDLGAYSVYVNDKPVALSSKEFEVLKFLAMHLTGYSHEKKYLTMYGDITNMGI